VPKDDIQRIKGDDEGSDKLKRKRKDIEDQADTTNENETGVKETIKDTNSDSKDIEDKKENRMDDKDKDNSNSQSKDIVLDKDKDDDMNKSDHGLHKYSKSDQVKNETDDTVLEDEENVENKKIKMVSMTEARRKAVGYERKFCYIIGFPIDLDMEELVAEMINLGCKNPSDIKW